MEVRPRCRKIFHWKASIRKTRERFRGLKVVMRESQRCHENIHENDIVPSSLGMVFWCSRLCEIYFIKL
jgi:hypothetical protein